MTNVLTNTTETEMKYNDYLVGKLRALGHTWPSRNKNTHLLNASPMFEREINFLTHQPMWAKARPITFECSPEVCTK